MLFSFIFINKLYNVIVKFIIQICYSHVCLRMAMYFHVSIIVKKNYSRLTPINYMIFLDI